MFKKAIIFLLGLVLLFVGFSFWMSPRLGGLLTFGDAAIDTNIHILHFDTLSPSKIALSYEDKSQDTNLIRLRETYQLDTLLHGCNSAFDKVIKIQSWVQSRWKHNGEQVPEKNDAVYILQEAEKGRQFRCVEYSIVATQCLSSLGFNVRSIGLMTKNISDVISGGGHVANEVYLKDAKKWVFIDPQFDVMATYKGIPLNAIELQQCIAHHWDFEIINPNQTTTKKDYSLWIGPYLYYFTTTIKGEPIHFWDRIIGAKKNVTLCSKGTKHPAYFQNLIRINNSVYTNSIADFYPTL